MSRRNPTGLSGILLVDKPTGMTSHDVVGAVRRITGERRVGHAGTLDPAATGLLVVLVGPSTRLAPWLTAAQKVYEARIVFGSETDTHDAEGAVTRAVEPPTHLTDREAAEAVAGLVGAHEQVPPQFSAIKVGGKTAHKVARAGGEIALEPRHVEVKAARLLAVDHGPPLAWDIVVSVSKGTYIRALARDLGRSLGTAAHLGGLRRTRSGTLRIEDAVSLEQLAESTDVTSLFTDPLHALALPSVAIDASDAALVSHGAQITSLVASDVSPGDMVAIEHAGRLLAIYERADDTLRAVTVLGGGAA